MAAHLALAYTGRVAAIGLISPLHDPDHIRPILRERIKVSKEGIDALANDLPYTETGVTTYEQTQAGYISPCRVLLDAKRPNYRAIRLPAVFIGGTENKLAPIEGFRKIFDDLDGVKYKWEELGVGSWVGVERGSFVELKMLTFWENYMMEGGDPNEKMMKTMQRGLPGGTVALTKTI